MKWFNKLSVVAFVAVIAVALCSGVSYGAEDEEEAPPGRTFMDNIKAGGEVGAIIILMSVGSLALMIEHLVSIRRERLIPPYTLSELEGLFDEEEFEEAMDLCDQEDSMLARVVGAGLAKIDGGYTAMKEAVEDVADEESSNLNQKIGYISLIAGIAPMMGLLGTVLGMIGAFDKIAVSKGATNPAQLADSISEALITTLLGLVVAIPTTAGYMFFRNRVMRMAQETNAIAGELIDRFRSNG